MTVRFYSSVAPATTLTSSPNSSATSIDLASTIGLPASFPFTLALDFGQVNEELVEVTNLGGLTATITRAVDGTSATSHSSGAVVRHVSSARDFTDSRTHENSAAGVHGLAMGSALVGTIDTQTLSNKTLASPILSGTVSGNATISGNNIYSGTSTFNAAALFQATPGTTLVAGTKVTGDANSRMAVRADGRIQWSDGTLAADTNLYREGPAALVTDGVFRAAGGLTADSSTVDSILFKGSTTGASSVIFRVRDSSNNSLTTLDDKGLLTTGSIQESTPDAWINNSGSLIWTTSSGLHLPSLGNATVAYYFKVISGTLYTSLAITFGSTTNFGSGATGTDNWQFSLPPGLLASAPFRNTQLIAGTGRATQNGNLTAPFSVNLDSSGGYFMFNMAGGQIDGNAPANSGTLDSITPWTWASGNVIAFSAVVPVT